VIAALRLDDFRHSRKLEPYGSSSIATIVAAIIPINGAAMIDAKINQSRSSGFIALPLTCTITAYVAAAILQVVINNEQAI